MVFKINVNFFLKLSVWMACCMAVTSCTDKKNTVKESGNNSEYYVAAYIWPSCHHDERFGDMLWPEGTGEWEDQERKPTI